MTPIESYLEVGEVGVAQARTTPFPPAQITGARLLKLSFFYQFFEIKDVKGSKRSIIIVKRIYKLIF